ncbi:hypothetical protein C0J52_26673 [Blattella germanica]|nr:hypothetical protein C0J52_26673 [Blattella germanica]
MQKDKYGNTLMHYAAEDNLMKVVEFLLELKCNFDCTYINGKTFLERAVIRGDEENAIKLLKRGSNPNKKMNIAILQCLMQLKRT